MTVDPTATPRVDLYVDPVCPFAYLATRWLLEVESLRPLDLHLQLMSLAVLNEHNPDAPDEADRGLDNAWRPVRVGAALNVMQGEAALRDYLVTFGDRFHRQRIRPRDRVIRETLADLADLDASMLVTAADNTEWDDAVRQSHARAVNCVGDDVGTPTLHIDGHAIFGPIFSAVPRGQDALDVYDGVLLLAENAGFCELKRTRKGELDFS